MEQLIATGKVAYAYVGITTQDVTPALARRYGLRATRGALIQSVAPGTPAEEAGLRASTRPQVFNGVPIGLGGDLIVAFAGQSVERAADVARIVTDRLSPGQTVPVTIVRGGTGKREVVRLRLVERPVDPQGLTLGLAAAHSGKNYAAILRRLRELSVESEADWTA